MTLREKYELVDEARRKLIFLTGSPIEIVVRGCPNPLLEAKPSPVGDVYYTEYQLQNAYEKMQSVEIVLAHLEARLTEGHGQRVYVEAQADLPTQEQLMVLWSWASIQMEANERGERIGVEYVCQPDRKGVYRLIS